MKLMKLMLLTVTAAAFAISLACAGATGNGNLTASNAVRPNTASATPGNPPAATPQQQHASERISLADAKKAFDENSAVFVDVRGPDAYKQEHIRGALNISLADLDTNLSKLPKGKKIIVYCS